jgi:hypothetical protein
MAFNGDSEVGIDGGGRCFYGEYPTRAITQGSPSFTNSHAPLAGYWQLHPTYGRYGAFRAFCDTQQRVSVPIKGKNYEMPVVNINTHDNLHWKPAVKGSFTLDANVPSPMVVSQGFYEFTGGSSFSDFLAFGKTPTLSMRVNTQYYFSLNAYMRVKAPPANINLIPVQFGIFPYEGSDVGRYKSDFYNYQDISNISPYPTWYLQKYKRVSGVVSPLAVDEVPVSGTEVRWASLKISYFDLLFVSKAPARIKVNQTSSPYVQGYGDFASQMQYDRIGIGRDDTFGWYSSGYNGGYYGFYNGGYGYYNGYYPYGAYGSYALPEGIGGSAPSRQWVVPYFDPLYPWVTV